MMRANFPPPLFHTHAFRLAPRRLLNHPVSPHVWDGKKTMRVRTLVILSKLEKLTALECQSINLSINLS